MIKIKFFFNKNISIYFMMSTIHNPPPTFKDFLIGFSLLSGAVSTLGFFLGGFSYLGFRMAKYFFAKPQIELTKNNLNDVNIRETITSLNDLKHSPNNSSSSSVSSLSYDNYRIGYYKDGKPYFFTYSSKSEAEQKWKSLSPVLTAVWAYYHHNKKQYEILKTYAPIKGIHQHNQKLLKIINSYILKSVICIDKNNQVIDIEEFDKFNLIVNFTNEGLTIVTKFAINTYFNYKDAKDEYDKRKKEVSV